MKHDLLIIGIVRLGDDYKIIAPDKSEHEVSRGEIADKIDELFTTSTEEVHTSRAKKGSRRTEEEIEALDERVQKVGAGIGEYMTHEYGETVGRVAGDSIVRGARGLTGFLRKISRP